MAKPQIRYSILPANPEAHLFEIRCTVDNPDPWGQKFSLPAWIPGSYLIREFAKHVVRIRAQGGRRLLGIAKLDKNTWQVEPFDGPVTVTMQVYAWDLSVRGAHLDTTHGFFNGPAVFLQVDERGDEPVEVEILPPRGAKYRGWRVATAMRTKGARMYGFGTYQAAGYDELIDHPVEMGSFALATFRAFGVQHDVAITGRHRTDMRRLCRDLKTLCETQIAFFGRPAPMDRYVFLVTAVGDGYGGLEHRASTALLCARNDLPLAGGDPPAGGYRTFLGLASHEYFHTWNVKRIKPAAFTPYDLDRENYTTLLWAFEGFTSYYDDLLLVRAGLMSPDAYLDTLGRNVTTLSRMAGRRKQTVAESSFDAWIKYYRGDENTPNAGVSYYLKGSLVALCLDLHIRAQTGGRRSLDHVMRALWRKYGMKRIGVPEDGIEKTAEQATGLKLARFFDLAVRSTQDLPLQRLLATVGVDMKQRPARSGADRRDPKSRRERSGSRGVAIGVRTGAEAGGVRLTQVFEGGAAQKAGLAAGDVVVAIDGLRCAPDSIDAMLGRYRPGDIVPVHAFRRDELHMLQLTLEAAKPDAWSLSASDDPVAARARRRWLGAE
ncbi:MAG TPA: PDZ domain-containing protein [Burkholderiales bacterium]|nr:PDZ domain-containing protein [Burkholderiales bacterium]